MAVDYQKYGSLIRSFHIKNVKVLRSVPCNCLVWENPAEVSTGVAQGIIGAGECEDTSWKWGMHSERESATFLWAAWTLSSQLLLPLFTAQCLRLKYWDIRSSIHP